MPSLTARFAPSLDGYEKALAAAPETAPATLTVLAGLARFSPWCLAFGALRATEAVQNAPS